MRMVTTDRRPSYRFAGADFLSIIPLPRVHPAIAHSGRLDLNRRPFGPSLNDRELDPVRSRLVRHEFTLSDPLISSQFVPRVLFPAI
jgi:hypothetical protein